MAYEAENIVYSQKIFYYLLCHGALSDADSGVNELYRAYVENEEVLHLVKSQVEIAECRVERYGSTIYLMPEIVNKSGIYKGRFKEGYLQAECNRQGLLPVTVCNTDTAGRIF